jgi:hypothetical protein
MRAIFTAIADSMRAAFGLCLWTFTFPFRLFMGGGGQAAPSVPTLRPMPRLVSSTSITDADHRKANVRSAGLVIQWCAASLKTDTPLPDKLSRDQKAWLPGLMRSEMRAIVRAGIDETTDHLMRKKLIDGVRAVGPLAPAGPRVLAIPKTLDAADDEPDSIFSLRPRRVAGGRRQRASA